jgi:ribonucleotide reductase class II
MNLSDKLLSEVVSHKSYAKFNPILNRRELLSETINRNLNMHLEKFPFLSSDILKSFKQIHELKVMPSMRSMQFGGEQILKNNTKLFNCSFANANYERVFAEALYVLLCGTGFGFSCQTHHVGRLPTIKLPSDEGVFIVHDSIAGWAEALDRLMSSYFNRGLRPIFNFNSMRVKGTRLSSGAKTPGFEPLQTLLVKIESKLKAAIGRKLTSLEVHDIMCIIADGVLSGGIRRAALISLFSYDDEAMLKCKQGSWWEKHPHRARSNNSAVLLRDTITEKEFNSVFDECIKSNSGEPGFMFSNSSELGANPCVSGDTEILTKEGYERIDYLVDQEVEIWNGFEWSKVIPKVTGHNQEMLTITFNDGRSLTCTKYHNFHIAKNYSGDVSLVKAKDLEVGMKLIKHEFPVLSEGPELEDAYTQGFVSAEGMELNRTLYIYKPKEMCIERLQNKRYTRWEEGNNRFRIILDKMPISKSMVPTNYSLKSKLNWLAGLFDGDGTELKEGGLQIVSVNKEFLKNLQKLLSTLGVQCKLVPAAKAGMKSMSNHRGGNSEYYCQDAYRVCVGAVQMQSLKSLGMKCERLLFNKTPQRDASQFISITDITESEIADTVYCFNEPKRHLGIFNGIITGQCLEISLNSNQFCNLTSVNLTGVTTKKDLHNRVYSAALLGTLQATYTDFPYLNPNWRKVTEEESLLGVSFTGIADNTFITPSLLAESAKLVLDVNEKYAKKLGINIAARATCVKPEGSASCVVGSSSGIHARHADYYLRRVRINKDDSLAKYLAMTIPELVEDDLFSSTGVVVTIPQESPKGAVTRHTESAETLFNRIMTYNRNWVAQGHRYGANQHNVSCTISYKPEEIDFLRKALWDNRADYSGISLLPFDGGTYKQAPFEDCTKEDFTRYYNMTKDIDLTKVIEMDDNTNHTEILACAGGVCEIV